MEAVMHTGFYPRLEFAVPFSSRTRPGGKGSPIFDVLLYRRGASCFVAESRWEPRRRAPPLFGG